MSISPLPVACGGHYSFSVACQGGSPGDAGAGVAIGDRAERGTDDHENDTTVVTVPTAYSAGEVTLVVIAQISSGSVFCAARGQHRAGESRRRTG